MRNNYIRGVMGVVTGDAFGCPVQFESREKVRSHPVTDMRGHGTFNLPEGSWTDDSSLTLALLASINRKKQVDLEDIMNNFMEWYYNGEFTPYGYSYDIGRGTALAIEAYYRNRDVHLCGGRAEWNNGNGSLMRIMPVCIYCVESGLSDKEAIELVHDVSALTHAHMRAKVACGLYYFMVKAILTNRKETIKACLQDGLNNGFAFYEGNSEIEHFKRLRDLDAFATTKEEFINSSGYVVDTIEASVWSLINTWSYKNAEITAVNLGWDTDSVGAVTGGLAGLYYGIGGNCGIPIEWLNKLQRYGYIADMCRNTDAC